MRYFVSDRLFVLIRLTQFYETVVLLHGALPFISLCWQNCQWGKQLLHFVLLGLLASILINKLPAFIIAQFLRPQV